jgi:CheY-like chemotaxis protein
VNAPRSKPDDVPPPVHLGETPEHDVAAALHEVSNALTVVLGWIERARGVAGVPLESARSLGVATTRARQAQRIVRRAIGASVPKDEPRALGEVVAEVVVGLEPEAHRSAVHLTTALDRAFAEATVESPESVAQILTNLLLNAIALSPRGAAVAVDGHVTGASAILGVADEGPGVDLSRRSNLLRAGATTRAGGAGIGLRHAASLAEASAGALALVESPRGARFELTWPCQPPGARAAPLERPRAVALEGARVLVVEDDLAVIELLDAALGARGAVVVSARSSSELYAALGTGAFTAALVDLSPIAADHRGALRRLREANPRARIVVISGSAKDLAPILREANLTWVRKPFEIAEVLKALGEPSLVPA